MQSTDGVYDGISFKSVDWILSQPNFRHARNTLVDANMDLYEYDPFLNRLLQESARNVLFCVAMCLHAGFIEADRSTWPTLRKLLDTLAPFQLASPRRLEALVARLIHTGYITSTQSTLDRRLRILAPSDKMLAHDLEWLIVHYKPLDALFPNPGYGRIMHRDRQFQFAQRLVAAGLFGEAARLLATSADVMLFMTRDAGIMILLKLIQTLNAASGGTAEPMSFANIGKRFGVSRTHVRLILQEAEAAELVKITGPGGRYVELSPRLLAAFDRFIAATMSLHDLCYQMALRYLDVAA
jgi:hypothetical protein